MKHLLILAPLALVAACSGPKSTAPDAPDTPDAADAAEPAAPTPVEPAAPEPAATVDAVVGTWIFDPVASWEENEDMVMSFIEPMLEGQPAEAVEGARAEVKSGFDQQSVEITLEADGSVNSRFRESEEEEWFVAVGDWVRDEQGVVTVTTYMVDEAGEADLESEPEVQVLQVAGDVMTVDVDAGFATMTMTFTRQ